MAHPRVEAVTSEARAAIGAAASSSELETVRVKYLGRSGALTQILKIKSEDSPVRVVLDSWLPGRGVCLIAANVQVGRFFLSHVAIRVASLRLGSNRSSALRKRKAAENDRDKEETKPRKRPAD